MNGIPNPSDAYTQAMRLQRALFDATAAANNPELAYPWWPEDSPLPELSRHEEIAELDYYRYLRDHRTELEHRPDLARDFRILDDLAAEGRDITALHTDTGDLEGPDPGADRDRGAVGGGSGPVRRRSSRTRGR